MTIRTSGQQAFNVPNDEEGRKFLELMKRYRNKGWTYRTRGRGPRSAPEGVIDPHFGSPASICQENSEWMAVYLRHAVQVVASTVQFMPAPWHVHPATVVNNALTMDCQVAEWSGVIYLGDPVAIGEDGRVYAEVVHGIGVAQEHFGIATTNITGGLIGEGEAVIRVAVSAPPTAIANVPVEGEQAGAAARSEDTTELTPEESELLEEIIKMAAGKPLFVPDKDLMDSLVNKLID